MAGARHQQNSLRKWTQPRLIKEVPFRSNRQVSKAQRDALAHGQEVGEKLTIQDSSNRSCRSVTFSRSEIQAHQDGAYQICGWASPNYLQSVLHGESESPPDRVQTIPQADLGFRCNSPYSTHSIRPSDRSEGRSLYDSAHQHDISTQERRHYWFRLHLRGLRTLRGRTSIMQKQQYSTEDSQ